MNNIIILCRWFQLLTTIIEDCDIAQISYMENKHTLF